MKCGSVDGTNGRGCATEVMRCGLRFQEGDNVGWELNGVKKVVDELSRLTDGIGKVDRSQVDQR